MTMRIQLQRRDERLGCSKGRRTGQSMPTTPARRPSCRRSAPSLVVRWVNTDPLGETDGPNLFRYCQNQPMNKKDSWGLKCCPDPNYNYDESWINQIGGSLREDVQGENGLIGQLTDAVNARPVPKGVPADKWKHCMVTCILASGDRPLEAIGAALISEIPLFRSGHSSWSDFAANWKGIWQIFKPSGNCSKNCACAVEGMSAFD